MFCELLLRLLCHSRLPSTPTPPTSRGYGGLRRKKRLPRFLLSSCKFTRPGCMSQVAAPPHSPSRPPVAFAAAAAAGAAPSSPPSDVVADDAHDAWAAVGWDSDNDGDSGADDEAAETSPAFATGSLDDFGSDIAAFSDAGTDSDASAVAATARHRQEEQAVYLRKLERRIALEARKRKRQRRSFAQALRHAADSSTKASFAANSTSHHSAAVRVTAKANHDDDDGNNNDADEGIELTFLGSHQLESSGDTEGDAHAEKVSLLDASRDRSDGSHRLPRPSMSSFTSAAAQCCENACTVL